MSPAKCRFQQGHHCPPPGRITLFLGVFNCYNGLYCTYPTLTPWAGVAYTAVLAAIVGWGIHADAKRFRTARNKGASTKVRGLPSTCISLDRGR